MYTRNTNVRYEPVDNSIKTGADVGFQAVSRRWR